MVEAVSWTGLRAAQMETDMKVRYAITLAAIGLSACTTPMNDIAAREVQDDVVVARPLAAVRDCLVSTLADLRTPVETGDDRSKVVAFSSAQAGMIFHYSLTSVDGGTRVQARRKNSIADGFNKARACYQ